MSIDNLPITPRLLKGFRDTLPDQLLIRNTLIHKITQVVTNFGFQPLETPALEYAEILQGKLGDEGEKLLYRFTDHGGRDVAMRYDFTVPLARVAAQYPDLPKPFKRFQVGPVWRADNTQRGRYREFYQYDLDIVGTDSSLADAEMLVLIQNILRALDIKNFTIRINHRDLLYQVIKTLEIGNDLENKIFTSIDKSEKVGLDSTVASWKNFGLSDSQVEGLKTYLTDPSAFNAAGGPISETLRLAESIGLDPKIAQIDGTIVRGLDYYTGLVFETTLTDAPEFGSIFSGGRYDNLVGRFTKQDIPAVGASVGLDRLIAAMDALDILPSVSNPTQVFVTVFNDNLQPYSLELAQKLRQATIPTELSYTTTNLSKQMKVANSKQIPFAMIAGPDEVAAQKLMLRDLRDGSEQTLAIDEAIEVIKSKT